MLDFVEDELISFVGASSLGEDHAEQSITKVRAVASSDSMTKDMDRPQQRRRERSNPSGIAAFADLEKFMRSTPTPFSPITPKPVIAVSPNVKFASVKATHPVVVHQIPLSERRSNDQHDQPMETMRSYPEEGYRVRDRGRQSAQRENANGYMRHPVPSPLAAPQPTRVNPYDPNKMHRLDQVLSSMSENGEGKEDVGIKGKHYDGDVTPVSPSPLHYTSLQYASDPPQAMESRMPDAGNPPAYDGPQVRLTMPAYQAMMKEMDNLKAEIARLAQDKIARFTDTLGIEKDLISKDVMDKLVSERDETIRRLQMELANLNRLRASSKSMLDDKPALRKIIEARDHEIDELKDRVSRGATKIDELLRAKQEAAAAASKNQELAVELANTKMTIRTMASDLEAEQNQVRLVTDQLNALRLRDNGPTIESLQQELKDKTTKMNRYRNDANAFKKQLQSKDLLCNKLTSDRTALKGAVVLVEPLATTKFTRTILACKECYVKNLSCDNGAKCQNCIDNGSRCVRWRCAQHHVLKACPDLPFCSVGHNEHGWLISEQERPRW